MPLTAAGSRSSTVRSVAPRVPDEGLSAPAGEGRPAMLTTTSG